LQAIAQEREMTVRDLARLLPKRMHDHRDYYLLANLIKDGYLHVEMSTTSPLLDEDARPGQRLSRVAIAVEMAHRRHTWHVALEADDSHLHPSPSGTD